MRHLLKWAVMAGSIAVLAGCSDFNKAIGKQKSAPDEFEVVVRPPLSLPPQFAGKTVRMILSHRPPHLPALPMHRHHHC